MGVHIGSFVVLITDLNKFDQLCNFNKFDTLKKSYRKGHVDQTFSHMNKETQQADVCSKLNIKRLAKCCAEFIQS